MPDEEKTPEIEGNLKKVRMKRPSEEAMSDYLSGVNRKIDAALLAKPFRWGSPSVLLAVSAALLLVGFLCVRFLIPRSENSEKVPVPNLPILRESSEIVPTLKPTTADVRTGSPAPVEDEVLLPEERDFTIEEELAILEALGFESDDHPAESLEADELAEEIDFLDDFEFGAPSRAQVSTGI